VLSDQGSNLDFPESKSGVLPVTPSDNFTAEIGEIWAETPCLSVKKAHFGSAKVELFFKKGK
jgi:hypothetical protein